MLPLLVVLAIITTLLILSGGCGCNKSFLLPTNLSPETPSLTRDPVSSSGQVVELYHFHPAQQCYSCQVLGDFAEETVNDLYAAQLRDGRLVFRHVNAEKEENAELVTRFDVTSSSLMVGYMDETGFHAENLVSLWYKLGDTEEFRNELSREINQRLGKREDR